MIEEAMPAPEPSEKDLAFHRSTREVLTQQKIATAVLTVDQAEGAQILAEHIRRKYRLGFEFEIKVDILNTDRTDDLCEVSITRVEA